MLDFQDVVHIFRMADEHSGMGYMTDEELETLCKLYTPLSEEEKKTLDKMNLGFIWKIQDHIKK